MSTIQCPSCDGEIEPGDIRVPTEEGPMHDYCELHESLFDMYQFYILNPPDDQFGISFWRYYEDIDEEFPVMSRSDTILINSSSTLYSGSDGIEPTEDFFATIAYSVHEVMAFTGGIMRSPSGGIMDQVEESFERVMGMFYDGNMPEHEREFGRAIVAQIIPHTFPYVIEELGPIKDFADDCTEFHLPEVHPALERDNNE